MATRIAEVTGGDPLLRAKINEVIRRVNGIGTVTGGGGVSVNRGLAATSIRIEPDALLGKLRPRNDAGILMVLTTTGPVGDEADYEDERYWATVVRLLNTDGDTTSAVTLGDPGGANDPRRLTVTATNIAEISNGTHALPYEAVDVYVRVYSIPDTKGVRKWYFNCPPSPYMIDTTA